jgi:hypothetical protein
MSPNRTLTSLTRIPQILKTAVSAEREKALRAHCRPLVQSRGIAVAEALSREGLSTSTSRERSSLRWDSCCQQTSGSRALTPNIGSYARQHQQLSLEVLILTTTVLGTLAPVNPSQPGVHSGRNQA